MKEAVGGISIFQIVIVFILLFTAIMCLTINHTKSFAVKDEIVNIIESSKTGDVIKNEGLTTEMINKITKALEDGGYRITGNCPKDYIGYDRNGNQKNNGAAFCIKPVRVDNTYSDDLKDICKNNKCIYSQEQFPKMVYFDIKLFYQLDIPIIKNIFNFTTSSSTKIIME